MKKYISFLLLATLLIASVPSFAAWPQRLSRRIQEIYHSRRTNVLQDKVLDLTVQWKAAPAFMPDRSICKGVLVYGTNRLLTHKNCFRYYQAEGKNLEFSSVEVKSSNKEIFSISSEKVKLSGDFAYVELNDKQLAHIAPTEVAAAPSNKGLLSILDRAGDNIWLSLGMELFRPKKIEDNPLFRLGKHPAKMIPVGTPVFYQTRLVGMAVKTTRYNSLVKHEEPVFTVLNEVNGGLAAIR